MCREEWLEDAHARCIIQTEPGVAYIEPRVAPPPCAGERLGKCLIELDTGRLEEEPSPPRHGVASVPGKIEEQLFYLSRVGLNLRESGIQDWREDDPGAENLLQARTQIHEEPVEIESVEIEDLLLTECQELLRQGRGPLHGSLDVLDISVKCGITAGAIAHQLAPPKDDREQVAELVSHSPRQEPQRL